MSFDAAWHEFLPDMTGPNPDFEVEEVLKLKSLKLSINFSAGGEQAARNEVEAQYRFLGKSLDESKLPKFQSLVYLIEDRISLCVYLSDNELTELVNNFKAFGALSGPKHYWGRLRSQVIAGSLSIGVQPEEKRSFLEGKIPGIIPWDAPRISFVSGTDLPAASDKGSTLTAMRQQF
ncbi:hypothetical protein [Profundibacter amoris]|uniref:hypothetical protein n=1 Tax=Profundibacter amoris TaxID=2171755 RepID=UPI0013C31BE6|nr:hypothetical protein [Profundibacter amoris]